MNNINKLYGDGIHDDTLAIQEMIDSNGGELTLPSPEKFYLISKPLELPSNFCLTLPRFAEIRLADNSNCLMLRNKLVPSPAARLTEMMQHHIWSYVDDFSPEYPVSNIEVRGGIWNCNNIHQAPNPLQQACEDREFYGFGILFYNATNIKLSSMTIKDPSNFGVTFDTVSYFTVEDITFDYNKGNPKPINMDGIHLCGNCHFGMIRNLKGACTDDLVALNADEGSGGPITNIEIDGIFAQNSHSAVRLLTVKQNVENVHISNVYGTYYQYCIGVTKYYKRESMGGFYSITVENVYASKAERTAEVYPSPNSYIYSLIWIDKESYVNSLTLRNLYRREYINPTPTVLIRNDTVIDRLIIDNAVTENRTSEPMPFLQNDGTVRYLSMRNIDAGDEELIVGSGTVENRAL